MPEVTDLMRVAQYVKSDRDAPSEVYNAACRLLDRHADTARTSEGTPLERFTAGLQMISHAVAEARGATKQDYALTPESPEKGAESHGDGRNPQTQGVSEGQEAREAQEASQ